MTSPETAPGWYPDPHGRPGQMYWDGTQWRTDMIAQPAPGSMPEAPMDQALGLAPFQPQGYGVPNFDAYGRPLSDKSKLVAGLLQIFLSPFAVGRFYLGYTNIALIQIAATFCTCGLGAWWPIIDGILIIMGRVPDPQGRALRD